MCGRRGLEKYVKGYRQIRNDLEKKREELATNQNPAQYHLRENLIKVEFYKPVVASRWVEVYQTNLKQFLVRTRKLGGLYRTDTVGRMGFFLHH